MTTGSARRANQPDSPLPGDSQSRPQKRPSISTAVRARPASSAGSWGRSCPASYTLNSTGSRGSERAYRLRSNAAAAS